jgi:hypothetical protein
MEKTLILTITTFIILLLILGIYFYNTQENLVNHSSIYNKRVEILKYQTGILNSYSLYLKYEKLINHTKYLKNTNLIMTNLENYSDINIDYNTTNIYLIQINNLNSFELVYNIVKDMSIKYLIKGDINFPDGEILYSEYINNINNHMDKYLFDTTINSKLENHQMIYDIIPLPKNHQPNNSITLYSGQAYTGIHFHVHKNLYSYLMKGKKIWMIMNDPYDFNELAYKLEDNLTPINWFINTIEYYSKKPNISIFIQNEGEVVFVPNGKHHFELNLEPSYGIFYESQ